MSEFQDAFRILLVTKIGSSFFSRFFMRAFSEQHGTSFLNISQKRRKKVVSRTLDSVQNLISRLNLWLDILKSPQHFSTFFWTTFGINYFSKAWRHFSNYYLMKINEKSILCENHQKWSHFIFGSFWGPVQVYLRCNLVHFRSNFDQFKVHLKSNLVHLGSI